MSDFNENNQQALPPTTQATPLSRLPTDIYNWYKAQMLIWFNRMTSYQTQIDTLLASPVESYTFSGGQGQQSAKRRDLEQAQRAAS